MSRLLRLIGAGIFGKIIKYLYRDSFIADVAAGSVNNSAATPGVATRVVTDTEDKISISGGAVLCAGQKTVAAFKDPQVLWDGVTRVAGRMACFAYKPTTNTKNSYPGLQNAGVEADGFGFSVANINVHDNVSYGTVGSAVAEYAGAAIYQCLIALRAAGAFFLVRGGKYPATLLYHTSGDTRTPITPALVNYSATWESNYVGVPQDLWLPAPELSDGFSAATSDGLAHAEVSLGGGGSGLAWTDRLGTWGVGSGVRSCSELGAGDIGICTAPITNTPHVVYSAKLTRSAGNVGVVVRYADADNYVYAYHDGTNVTLRKVLGGVDSEVMAATAATYSAGKRMVIIADCQRFKIIYNETAVGATQEITDAALQTGTGVGLFTSNTGNTFDDALCYARGVEGQYNFLFDKYFPNRARVNIYCIGDSKTAAADGYVEKMSTYSAFFAEYPYRYAVAGLTTANAKLAIDARLAITHGTPDYVLYNLGVNDTNGADGITPSEADWKTNTAYILDAVHTKWPNAKVYMMKNWCRLSPNACLTLATWGATVRSTRSSWCFLGPDESVFLEGGDNGATYTSDGVHPTAPAGYTLTASQWRTAIGY